MKQWALGSIVQNIHFCATDRLLVGQRCSQSGEDHFHPSNSRQTPSLGISRLLKQRRTRRSFIRALKTSSDTLYWALTKIAVNTRCYEGEALTQRTRSRISRGGLTLFCRTRWVSRWCESQCDAVLAKSSIRQSSTWAIPKVIHEHLLYGRRTTARLLRWELRKLMTCVWIGTPTWMGRYPSGMGRYPQRNG